MREFRKGKGVTEHYTSLTDLAEAWGCKKPRAKQPKDKKVLEQKRENFRKHHICKGCGTPMTWIGESMMCCTNPECKGVKHERKDAEDNVIVTYSVSCEILEDKFAEAARNLFFEN